MGISYRDEGNVVLREGRVVVQLRWGLLTEGTLAALQQSFDDARAEGDVPLAVLVALLPEAPPPPHAMRERQRRLVPALAASPDLFAAIAIPGEGVAGSLLRGILPPGLERVHLASSIERACRWLAKATGVSAAELRACVEAARAARDVGA